MIENLIASLFILLFVGIFFLGIAVVVARQFIYIASPNEVLVFSGGRYRTQQGERGYRLVKGGRGFRIPLLEKVDRVDLTNLIIEVAITNAYSRGGIPLNVQGVANLKIASHEPALGNAIERFLNHSRQGIIKIAKDTVEGNLRGVLSQLTPEQINEDKSAFAQKLLEEAEHDLSRLGLSLDNLKIQNVSDDVHYLNSIGRKRSADVVKNARIAEAQAKALSTQREAENKQTSELARIDADMQVSRAQIDRRIKDAQTKKDAMVAEQLGQVKTAIAKAKADVSVQQARVQQVKRRLEADVITPAKAEAEARIAKARGDAASIIENGKATVAVLDEMIRTWKQGGESAREIFLMQKLQGIMGSLVDTIQSVKVDRVTMLPAGGGAGASQKTVQLVEELKGALGVDLPALFLGKQLAEKRHVEDDDMSWVEPRREDSSASSAGKPVQPKVQRKQG